MAPAAKAFICHAGYGSSSMASTSIEAAAFTTMSGCVRAKRSASAAESVTSSSVRDGATTVYESFVKARRSSTPRRPDAPKSITVLFVLILLCQFDDPDLRTHALYRKRGNRRAFELVPDDVGRKNINRVSLFGKTGHDPPFCNELFQSRILRAPPVDNHVIEVPAREPFVGHIRAHVFVCSTELEYIKRGRGVA